MLLSEIQIVTSTSKDVEKLELLCTASRNIKRDSDCGKQPISPSKKLKMKLTYDPAIPLSGYISKRADNKNLKETYVYSLSQYH